MRRQELKKDKPPLLGRWLLRLMVNDEDFQELAGDFYEAYAARRASLGKLRAVLWYWNILLKSIPAFYLTTIRWRSAMFSNYFKVAVRNIRKQRGYAFINISGLALGMACCLLILLWVTDEVSYDRHFENADRIYRLIYGEEEGDSAYFAPCPFGAPKAFKDEIPGIDAFTTLLYTSGLFHVEDQVYEEEELFYVDPDFFRVFSHRFLSGDGMTALNDPQTIVITRSMARKFFGTESVQGRTIAIADQGDFRITGVIDDVPENSHFTFHAVISNHRIRDRMSDLYAGWMFLRGYVYMLLEENADPQVIKEKMDQITENHVGEESRSFGYQIDFRLQKLTDIHLKSNEMAEIAGQGDIRFVYIFSAIAVFILVIACINFMNLSTARSAKRSREVGMRKVLGAQRKRLVVQFLGEAVLMAALAMILALITVSLVLPFFNGFTGKSFSLGAFAGSKIWMFIICIVLFTGTAAGSYPALYLSSFQPARTLKGGRDTAEGSRFRNFLVVFQFAVSAILIASTIVILGQIRYMKQQFLGFEKDHVMVIRMRGNRIREQAGAFKQELLTYPGIQQVSTSRGHPGRVNILLSVRMEGRPSDEWHDLFVIYADYDFAKTYGMNITYGRDYSTDFGSDANGAFLLNEKAVEEFGMNQSIIGKRIGFGEDHLTEVVGVVENFHFESLQDAIAPLAIRLTSDDHYYASLKIVSDDVQGTVDLIRSVWDRFEPDRSFQYYFIDERFDRMYRNEERVSTLVSSFAIIAIVIACLGLLGLASFVAEQKTKEVGIRKVLGSSAGNILLLLSRRFFVWVLVANAVGLPVAYYLMRQHWLPEFAYRMRLGPVLFLISAVISVVIAAATVGYQALRAALANPVESLRYE